MSDELVVSRTLTSDPSRSTFEYTLWFTLDGTLPIEAVSAKILETLREADISGIASGEFRSPFAKEYPQ